jgi:hypothetical protein
MQSTPTPTDKEIVASFNNLIDKLGQSAVLQMAYANNDLGKLARRFFKLGRRATLVYHNGTWYYNGNVVDGPTKLTTLNPDMGASQYPRPTVPDARGTSYKENGLACDKHRPRGIINTNGRDRNKVVDPDASPLDGVPFVARPLKAEPVKAEPQRKSIAKEKGTITVDGKTYMVDKNVADYYNSLTDTTL